MVAAETKRIGFLDIAKGLGIILVVEGHCINGSSLTGKYIWMFHMPLFFLIAGILFDFNRYPDTFGFVRRQISQIMLPCLFFTIIVCSFSFLFGLRNDFQDLSLALPGALWFLPVLFGTEILFYITCRLIRDNIFGKLLLILAFAYIGIYLKSKDIGSAYSLSSIFPAFAYYGVGNVLGPMKSSIIRLDVKQLSLLSLLVVLPMPMVYYFQDSINLSGNYIPHPFILFYVVSILTCLGVFCFSELIYRKSQHLDWLTFFGRNTIIILSLHMLYIGVSSHYLSSVFTHKLENKLIELIVVWTLTLFSIYAINKYARWLVPKK